MIEVTAQKRLQSVQDIPISIYAISTDTLEAVGIENAAEITSLIPNVNSTRSISGISNYYIRGVGMDGFNLASVPAVGLYLDDVAIINPSLANFTLFDIARVEVLKGPQNTLYGKNTTGGAINFIANQPTQDLQGYAQVAVGSFQQRNVKGAISSEVSKKLSVRLAGFTNDRDGVVSSNLESNNTKFNDIDQQGLRVKLSYQVAEEISLMASLYGGKQRQIAEVKTAMGATSNDMVIDLAQQDLTLNHSALINPPNHIDALGGFIKLQAQFDQVSFTSISAFEKVQSKRMDDWGSQHLPGSVFQSITYNSTDTQNISQELQWQSSQNQDFQWIAGLLYNHEYGDLLQAALIDPAGPGRPDDNVQDAGIGPMFDRGAWVDNNSKTTSAYGQFSYALNDKLNLTTGLRWTVQNLAPTVHSVGMMMDLPGQEFPLGSLGWLSLGNPNFNRLSDYMGFEQAENFIQANKGYAASANIDQRFSEWGGKLALDYRTSAELMFYGSLSRGFKMGAVNSNPTTVAYQSLIDKVVTPETLITSEIGFKSDLLNQSLRINAALFYNLWQDYQFYLVYNPGNPANLFASLTNLPEAKSRGAELELSWKISPSFKVDLGIAWLDSQVTDGQIDSSGIPEQNRSDFQSQVQTGNRLTNAPKWTASLALQKQFDFESSELVVTGHYQFLDEHIHQLAGAHSVAWIENFSEQAIGILSLNVQFLFGENRQYHLSLWGKNLTDEQYCTERAIAPGASPESIRLCSQGDFRSVGLTAKMLF